MKKHKRFIAMLIAGIFVSASVMTQRPVIAVQAEENIQSTDEQSIEPEKVEVSQELEQSGEVEQSDEEMQTEETKHSEKAEKSDEAKQEQLALTDDWSDKIAPEVTSVKRLSEGLFSRDSEIEYEVGVIEEDSGIKSIEMSFLCEKNSSVWILSCENYIEPGTRSIVLSPSAKGDSVGEHKIQRIEIEDYAGNRTTYEITEDDTILKGTVNGKEKSITVSESHNSFAIVNIGKNLLKIKNIRFADDVKPDNVAAGDTLNAIVTIYNDGEERIKVDPKDFRSEIYWNKKVADNHYDTHTGYSTSDAAVLQPGEEYELVYKTTISPYTMCGNSEVNVIQLRAYYENGIPFYMSYTRSGDKLNMLDVYGDLADQIPYDGELDFQITTADNPDKEEPLIESISVEQDSLKAPGSITFKIKTKGKEIAPIMGLGFHFQDVNIPANSLDFGGQSLESMELERDKVSYSEEEDCYLYKTELDEGVIRGTYVLEDVAIADEAGNSAIYHLNEEGELQYGTETFSPFQFTVTEAQETDMDFTSPILKSAELMTKKVEMSSDFGAVNVQVTVEVEDEKGLSSVAMYYGDKNGETLNLECENATKREEGKYLCTFVMPRYCVAGEYTLKTINLTDASVRFNTSGYSYDEETESFIAMYPEDRDAVKASGSMTLTISPAEDYVVTDIDSAVKTAQEMEDGGTIVVKGLYADIPGLPKLSEKFIAEAKKKNLNIIIPDAYETSELVIKGQDIPDGVAGEITLGLFRGDMVLKEISEGSEEDDVYYPITVVTSNTDVPATLRVKLDQDFMALCGKKGLRFSKDTAFGESELLVDNLEADKNGYVEVQMEKGWNNANSRLRTTSQEMEFSISGKKQDSSDVMLGDIDGDGKVAMTDLMQCLHHMSGSAVLSGTKYEAADINGDGSITMADVVKILHYVSGRSDTLA